MADLLDIAPATAVEIVRITGDRRVKVQGLHGNAIAAIAARFPDLVLLLGSMAGGGDVIARLFGQFGAAIAPIIAAGCGHLGDEHSEKIAGRLLVEDQAKLLKAIFGLTFPNGFGPFMESVAALMTGPTEKEKTVRVRLKKSPSASPPSSAADFPQTMQ